MAKPTLTWIVSYSKNTADSASMFTDLKKYFFKSIGYYNLIIVLNICLVILHCIIV